MKKKTIIHIIYSLGRGGAETMLVKVLKELPEYQNIVVTLEDNNQFNDELHCDNFICLDKPSMFSIPAASLQLNKIIKKYKAGLVHSHLPQANFIARLATPKNIPLIFTIHTSINVARDYKKWYIRYLDKFTFLYKRSIIIAVSQAAANDYFSVLKLPQRKTIILNTFVDLDQFKSEAKLHKDEIFKVISVGSLRHPKNYIYLINAFKKIKNKNIELHIYGAGPLKESLQVEINNAGVPVFLKGQVNNVPGILPQYDLYVMSSLLEGFSLSVLEAMAMRIPLLLSNIPSFKEQCEEGALYFDLNNTSDFVEKLLQLKENKELRSELSEKSYKRVSENYTLQHHLEKLKEIYKHAIEEW